MHWNYRMVRKDGAISIHEVYYTSKDDGSPLMGTIRPIYPAGATEEEFRRDFANYAKALERPVLEFSDFATDVPRKE